MPRSPAELLAEIAAWPIEERLRLAGRIMEVAAAEIDRLKARRAQPAAPPVVAPLAGPAAERPGHPVRHPASGLPPRVSGSGQPPAAAPVVARHLVIVDGSNFLGTVAGFDLAADASRDELVMRLQEFARDHPALRVVVYFDGQKVTVRRAGGVEVRFTSGEKPADFFILEAIRTLEERDRPLALLITADRALGDAARKLNAKVEAPSSFHRRLPGVKRTAVGERGLSAAEVADWESYFQKPPDSAGGPRKR